MLLERLIPTLIKLNPFGASIIYSPPRGTVSFHTEELGRGHTKARFIKYKSELFIPTGSTVKVSISEPDGNKNNIRIFDFKEGPKSPQPFCLIKNRKWGDQLIGLEDKNQQTPINGTSAKIKYLGE